MYIYIYIYICTYKYIYLSLQLEAVVTAFPLKSDVSENMVVTPPRPPPRPSKRQKKVFLPCQGMRVGACRELVVHSDSKNQTRDIGKSDFGWRGFLLARRLESPSFGKLLQCHHHVMVCAVWLGANGKASLSLLQGVRSVRTMLPQKLNGVGGEQVILQLFDEAVADGSIDLTPWLPRVLPRLEQMLHADADCYVSADTAIVDALRVRAREVLDLISSLGHQQLL